MPTIMVDSWKYAHRCRANAFVSCSSFRLSFSILRLQRRFSWSFSTLSQSVAGSKQTLLRSFWVTRGAMVKNILLLSCARGSVESNPNLAVLAEMATVLTLQRVHLQSSANQRDADTRVIRPVPAYTVQ